MPEASSVTFDILLGGKVTPALLKSFKDLEEMMKKQGATAKTINAIMGRAYKETFDEMGKSAKKGFEEVEKHSTDAFHKLVEQAREAEHKIKESFEKMKEAMEPLMKFGEFFGVGALIGGVGAAITGEELIKKGVEVHRER